MPRTHDIGCLYWHTLKSPGPPKWGGRSWTEEIEAPYREGRGWACRIGLRRVLIVGRWRDVERTEDEALMAALGASALTTDVLIIKEWSGGDVPAESSG